jgi:hypothetical protein
MAGYTCPFCQQIMSITNSTHITRYPSFDRDNDKCSDGTGYDKDTVALDFYRCPNCQQPSIFLRGLGDKVNRISVPIHPNSISKQFPNYIPQQIRDDYSEACAIVNLSPKASATLSRRCLQGMIRDFWGISKQKLVQEIDALQGQIPTMQWQVIDSVRRIGNIGAHMEKDINQIIDIDENEAQKLILLIERLIQDWYIQRHEQEQLYADIIGIDADKKVLKNPKK